MKNRLPLFIGLLVFVSLNLLSQNAAETTALDFLRANAARFDLTAADVAEVRITDNFQSKNNGLTHVWAQQQHRGVPVAGALFGLHVTRDGQVLTVGHRFVAQISDKVKSVVPVLSAEKSLLAAMASINFGGFDAPRLLKKVDNLNFQFDGGAVSSREIPVALVLLPISDGAAVRLAWDLQIWQANSSAVWSIRVDAASGEILEKKDLTSQCKFPEKHDHAAGGSCSENIDNQAEETFSEKENVAGSGGAAASYNVFEWPVESPAHGSRTVVSDPFLPTASPLGWHATGDQANQKFTYTRGNNIRAYDDSDNNNQPPTLANEVDGGATLTFNFPFDNTLEPEMNRKAAVTNLFYTTNMMHDLAHRYGMDEVGGAYQTNNFGKGGAANDHVSAEALDGSGTDNANFSPAVDGQTGRIQMYKWAGTFALTANAPAGVAKNYLSKAASGWGGAVTQTPLTGDVVIADDGKSNPTSLGCAELVNDVAGKIVMVDRGICEFGEKALYAEQAGAIGCIICNYENQLPTMGVGGSGGQVTIPVISMRSSDCDILRQFAGNGLNVSLVLPPQTGPNFYDGDLDNGIIAHEYGHGISNRLVGGPSTMCLGNAEQMGEGWSDFFSLVTSVKPGDVGAKKRAVGTYVFREPNDGGGIRRFPYSTDLNVQPLTFYNVAHNTAVHSLGEIWAAMLWDLYWAMVEKHGWSADIMNGTAGNNKAIQLVMDGMKLTPCSPGFVDGRDAILKADLADFAGENQCLIWKVFARRGLGEGASQGSTDNGGDGKESFEVPITCQNELTLKKTTQTPLINPGDDVKYVITVRNGKSAAVSNVVVTDEIPAGLTPVTGTINNGGQFAAGKITWNLGPLQPTQSMTLTYTAKSDLQKKSTRFHFDDLEDGGPDWISYSVLANATNSFNIQSAKAKSGTKAFKADNLAEKTDYMLYNIVKRKVLGARPVLRFWHSWQTEVGIDGGFVEISEDEQAWKRVARSKFIRNGYTGGIPYSTVAIPYNDGFSGTQATFQDSYIDLSEYAGKEIFIRYRFVSDDADAADGWYLDDFELLDLFNYDAQACATTGQGDNVCAKAPVAGVIVNSSGTSSTDDLKNQLKISVQPNPAHDFISVFAGADLPDETRVALLSADGKILRQQILQNLPAGRPVAFDLADLPQGIYFVKIETGRVAAFEKVVRQ